MLFKQSEEKQIKSLIKTIKQNVNQNNFQEFSNELKEFGEIAFEPMLEVAKDLDVNRATFITMSLAISDLTVHNKSIIERLIQELSEDDDKISIRIIQIFYVIGTEVVPVLIKCVEKDPDTLDWDERMKWKNIRKNAAKALGLIGDSRALGLLENARNSKDSSLALGATWALLNWGKFDFK